VAQIPGEPRLRVIHRPRGYAPFGDFYCGSGEPEAAVNRIVAAQYAGREEGVRVVVMETPRAGLVGVAAFSARELTLDVLPTPWRGTRSAATTVTVPDAAYIHAIGLDENFRGHRVEGGARAGTFLLQGTLDLIREAFGGEVPWTWAYLDPANAPSQRLFHESGFGYVPPQGPVEDSKRVLPSVRFDGPLMARGWRCGAFPSVPER